MKVNDRSLLQLVYDNVSEACNGITTTFYSDITDPLLDIWSGAQIRWGGSRLIKDCINEKKD